MKVALNKAYIAFGIFMLTTSASRAILGEVASVPVKTLTPPLLLLSEQRPDQKTLADEGSILDLIYEYVIGGRIHLKQPRDSSILLIVTKPRPPKTDSLSLKSAITPESQQTTPSQSETQEQLLREIQQLKDQVTSLSELLELNREHIAINNLPRESTKQQYLTTSSYKHDKPGKKTSSPSQTNDFPAHRSSDTPGGSHFREQTYSPPQSQTYQTPDSSYSGSHEAAITTTQSSNSIIDSLKQEKSKLQNALSRLKQRESEDFKQNSASGFKPYIPALLPSLSQQTKNADYTSSPAASFEKHTKPFHNKASQSKTVTVDAPVPGVISEPLPVSPAGIAVILVNLSASAKGDNSLPLKKIQRIEQQITINWLQPLLSTHVNQSNLITSSGQTLQVVDSVPFALMLRKIHHLPESIIEYILKQIIKQRFTAWIQGYKVGPVAASNDAEEFIWYSPLGDTLSLIHRHQDNIEALSRRISLAFSIMNYQAKTLNESTTKPHKKISDSFKNASISAPRTSVDASVDERKLIDINGATAFLVHTLETHIRSMNDTQLVHIGSSIAVLEETLGVSLGLTELITSTIKAARINQRSQLAFEAAEKDRIRQIAEDGTPPPAAAPLLIPAPPPPPAIVPLAPKFDTRRMKKRRDMPGIKIHAISPELADELKTKIQHKKPLTSEELRKIEAGQEERRRQIKEASTNDSPLLKEIARDNKIKLKRGKDRKLPPGPVAPKPKTPKPKKKKPDSATAGDK